MSMSNLGNKTEQFLFKMQPAVRKTLEVNAKKHGMSMAEYLINLIINDSPNLKNNQKSLKKLKKKLLKNITEILK